MHHRCILLTSNRSVVWWERIPHRVTDRVATVWEEKSSSGSEWESRV